MHVFFIQNAELGNKMFDLQRDTVVFILDVVVRVLCVYDVSLSHSLSRVCADASVYVCFCVLFIDGSMSMMLSVRF